MYIARILTKDDPVHYLNTFISTLAILDVDTLEECLPALKEKCNEQLNELLDLEYEDIEHIQLIHITKENMYGILNDLKEHEKEELFSALLEEIDW